MQPEFVEQQAPSTSGADSAPSGQEHAAAVVERLRQSQDDTEIAALVTGSAGQWGPIMASLAGEVGNGPMAALQTRLARMTIAPSAAEQVRTQLEAMGVSKPKPQGMALESRRELGAADYAAPIALGLLGPQAENAAMGKHPDLDVRRLPGNFSKDTGDATLTGTNPMRDVGIHGAAGALGFLQIHNRGGNVLQSMAGAFATGFAIEISQAMEANRPGSRYDIARTSAYGSLFALALIGFYRTFERLAAQTGSPILGIVRDVSNPKHLTLWAGPDGRAGFMLKFDF